MISNAQKIANALNAAALTPEPAAKPRKAKAKVTSRPNKARPITAQERAWWAYCEEKRLPITSPVCVAWAYERGDIRIHPDTVFAKGTLHELVGCCKSG